MYNAGLVCVVKVNGRILRESMDEVYLPFNSEYSILIKNLESRKALVNISIDSQDVLDGNSLIIGPNEESELKGFMNGNKAKNKFKFIQKTKEISEFRGDKIDDGIIRLEYWFEQLAPQKQMVITEHWHYNYTPPCLYNCLNCYNNCCNRRYYKYDQSCWTTYNSCSYDSSGSSGISGISGAKGFRSSTTTNANSRDYTTEFNCLTDTFSGSANFSNTLGSITSSIIPNIDPLPNEGITVKGSEVNQNFNYGNIGRLEDSSRVIILKLIGSKSGSIIEKPLTIQSKKCCPTCGKKSKSHVKFCPGCGTFLE